MGFVSVVFMVAVVLFVFIVVDFSEWMIEVIARCGLVAQPRELLNVVK